MQGGSNEDYGLRTTDSAPTTLVLTGSVVPGKGRPGGEGEVRSPECEVRRRDRQAISARRVVPFWLIVSPPDAKWKAPYSARFHVGASAPGG